MWWIVVAMAWAEPPIWTDRITAQKKRVELASANREVRLGVGCIDGGMVIQVRSEGAAATAVRTKWGTTRLVWSAGTSPYVRPANRKELVAALRRKGRVHIELGAGDAERTVTLASPKNRDVLDTLLDACGVDPKTMAAREGDPWAKPQPGLHGGFVGGSSDGIGGVGERREVADVGPRDRTSATRRADLGDGGPRVLLRRQEPLAAWDQ